MSFCGRLGPQYKRTVAVQEAPGRFREHAAKQKQTPRARCSRRSSRSRARRRRRRPRACRPLPIDEAARRFPPRRELTCSAGGVRRQRTLGPRTATASRRPTASSARGLHRTPAGRPAASRAVRCRWARAGRCTRRRPGRRGPRCVSSRLPDARPHPHQLARRRTWRWRRPWSCASRRSGDHFHSRAPRARRV